MRPRISVVMAAHNAATTLGQAVRSLDEGDEHDYEVVVVDDGSTDDTAAIAAALARRDERVRVVQLPANRGAGAARNAGLAVARGGYVAIHDADDICCGNRLKRQADWLDREPDWVISGQFRTIETSPALLSCGPTDPSGIRRRFQGGTMGLVHGASMFRSEYFARFGGYREQFRRSQDFDLLLRGALIVSMSSLPDVVLLYRGGPSPSLTQRARRHYWRHRVLESNFVLLDSSTPWPILARRCAVHLRSVKTSLSTTSAIQIHESHDEPQ